MEDKNTGYNMYNGTIIEGTLDLKRLEDVFTALIRRHEVFRTSFGISAGEIVQTVLPHADFQIEYRESSADLTGEIRKFIRVFDFRENPFIARRIDQNFRR